MKALISRLIRRAIYALIDRLIRQTQETISEQLGNSAWIAEEIEALKPPVRVSNTHRDYMRSVDKLDDLERRIRAAINRAERNARRTAGRKYVRMVSSGTSSIMTASYMKFKAIGDMLIKLDDSFKEVRNAKRAMLGVLDRGKDA